MPCSAAACICARVASTLTGVDQRRARLDDLDGHGLAEQRAAKHLRDERESSVGKIGKAVEQASYKLPLSGSLAPLVLW